MSQAEECTEACRTRPRMNPPSIRTPNLATRLSRLPSVCRRILTAMTALNLASI